MESNLSSKLTRGVMRQISQATGTEDQVRIIVRYAPTRRIMRHRAFTPGIRETYHYRLQPFVAMQATPEAVRALAQDPDVVRIYEDQPVYAYLNNSVPHIEVPRLWNEGLTGENVRIAFVDTGIDPEHPDLKGRITAMTDFTGEGPIDRSGHGTHCASTAAGSGAASGAKYRGVAPRASIYAAKVLRASGQGMMSDVMAGIEWAVEQGVQVISLSLGSPGPCDGTDALCDTCEAAIRMGIVVCAAAGNEGPNPYTVGSPGCAPNVITVGACDNADRIAEFSSRGPTADGRIKPDILFPGVAIVAARAQGTSIGAVVDDTYTAASGTSMSAPHAAGTCALLLQAEPALSPLQIKDRLLRTAIDLGASPYTQGKGRADAWRARNTTDEPGTTPTPPVVPPGTTPGEGCLPAMVKLLFLGRK